MFEKLGAFFAGFLGENWKESIGTELAADPLEFLLALSIKLPFKAIKGIKTGKKYSAIYNEVNKALIALDAIEHGLFEKILEELNDNQVFKSDRVFFEKIKSFFSKEKGRANAADVNRTLLNSLDFNVGGILELECVKNLDGGKKNAIKDAFEKFRKLLTELHNNMLNNDSRMLINVIDYRIGDTVEYRVRSLMEEFFYSPIENGYEPVTECPICGRPTLKGASGETVECEACHHTYALKKRGLSENGGALNKLFAKKLDDIEQSISRLGGEVAEGFSRVESMIEKLPEENAKALIGALNELGVLRSDKETVDTWLWRIYSIVLHIECNSFNDVKEDDITLARKYVTVVSAELIKNGDKNSVKEDFIKPWGKASKKYERYLKRRAAGDKIMAPLKRLWAKVKKHPWISFGTVITIFAVVAVTIGAIFSPATLIDPETGIAMDASYHDKTKEMAAVEAVAETYALDSIAKTHGISDISQIDTRAFDITLSDSTSPEVQPKAEITISIPLTEYELTAKENIRVFHQGSTSAEFIESRIVGDKVEFKTDHLSVYIVAVVPYDVEFVSGGEVILKDAKLHGNHIDVPAAELTGHSFICWKATKADGSTVKLTPDTKRAYITENVKFTAYYAPESYTLNISSDGISTAGSVILTYGEEYTLPENLLAKTGYTVRNISIADIPISSSGVWNIDVDTVPEIQRYIYAPMSANEYKVLLNLNIPEGSGASYDGTVESLECFYDSEYALPKSPIDIDGWKQVGWSLSSDGSGTVYTVGSKIKNLTAKDGGEVVLFADWVQNNYTVHFDSNKPTGASSEITGTMADITLTYDADATPLTANAFALKGHTFAGWSTSRDGEVVYSDGASVKNLATDGSITLFAKWKANSYEVIFNKNKPTHASHEVSGTMPSVVHTYDSASSYTIPECIYSLAGWSFIGWSTTAGGDVVYTDTQSVKNLAIGGNITLYAKWRANTYKVNFNKNKPINASDEVDGSMPQASLIYDSETSYTLPESAYSLTGWRFIGWSTAADGDVVYADTQSVKNLTVSDSITLYARWQANTYRVEFMSNKPAGATHDVTGITRAITLTYDSAESLPSCTFELEGYSFDGWSTKSNGSEVLYINEQTLVNLTPVNGDVVVLYATWSECLYSIRFDKNTPTNASSRVSGSMRQISCNTIDNFNLPSCEYTLAGWSFVEWNTLPDGSGDGYLDCAEIIANGFAQEGDTVCLYAIWQRNTYTVKFNSNKPVLASGEVSGVIPAVEHTYDNESFYALPECGFTLTGWSFIGWSTSASGEVIYTDGYSVKNLATDGDVTLYAKWQANSYSIIFNSNRPSLASEDVLKQISPINARYDSTLDLPKGYSIKGWTFLGWATSADGGVAYDDEQSVKNLVTGGSITLYAKWSANTYTVKFNANKPDLAGKEVEGHLASVIHTYDSESAYALPQNGYSLVGWEFLGWATSKDGEVAYSDMQSVKNLVTSGSITLYAKWRANIYTVTFDKNEPANASGNAEGGMLQVSQLYDSDTLYILPKCAYSLNGWSFRGWATSADGDVVYTDMQSVKNLATSGNVTLYARWRANTYTVIFDSNKPSCASGEISGQVNPVTVEYDKKFALSTGYSLMGWSFVGWATSKDGVPEYDSMQSVDNLTSGGSVTLYAKWQANTYTVYFDANKPSSASGEIVGAVEPVVHTYDPEVPYTLEKCRLTLNGWSFRGWSNSKTGWPIYSDEASVKNLGSIGSVTLYAIWEQNKYTVEFEANKPESSEYEVEGDMPDMQLSYDDAASDSGIIGENGYSLPGWNFLGWSSSPTGAVAYRQSDILHNLTAENDGAIKLYAVWAVDPYTVGKYVSNGAVVKDTDGTNSYTVYNRIEQTPRLECTGKVIVDWSSCTAGDHSYKNAVNSTGSRYGGGSDDLDIVYGVTEVFFIGNPVATYTDLRIVTYNFLMDSTLTLHLKNMNISATKRPIDSWYVDSEKDIGMYLTIDCIGNSSITATGDGAPAIDNRKNLAFIGSGSLEIKAGDGHSYISQSNGGDGGDAIIASNVIIDMSGTLTVSGGNGGHAYNRSSGDNSGNCSNGRGGYVGGTGGDAFAVESLTIIAGKCEIAGGNGGNGGSGSEGNDCLSPFHEHYGGNGGDAGSGGTAVNATVLTVNEDVALKLTGGNGGKGGTPGGMHEEGYENPGTPGKGGSLGSAISSTCTQTISENAITDIKDGEAGAQGEGLNWC
ncbi:MAG: InlB B-repeat-containing protein [Clostridia bacterium]|nr:InlB B-repeat-containing protein [Clostridia bacterium]